MSKSIYDDGLIDKKEFFEYFKVKETYLLEKLFIYFDNNFDQFVNFREFILGNNYLKGL